MNAFTNICFTFTALFFFFYSGTTKSAVPSGSVAMFQVELEQQGIVFDTAKPSVSVLQLESGQWKSSGRNLWKRSGDEKSWTADWSPSKMTLWISQVDKSDGRASFESYQLKKNEYDVLFVDKRLSCRFRDGDAGVREENIYCHRASVSQCAGLLSKYKQDSSQDILEKENWSGADELPSAIESAELKSWLNSQKNQVKKLLGGHPVEMGEASKGKALTLSPSTLCSDFQMKKSNTNWVDILTETKLL